MACTIKLIIQCISTVLQLGRRNRIISSVLLGFKFLIIIIIAGNKGLKFFYLYFLQVYLDIIQSNLESVQSNLESVQSNLVIVQSNWYYLGRSTSKKEYFLKYMFFAV